MSVLLLLATVAPSFAADPELVVVGAHLPGLLGDAPYDAADVLANAVDATNRAQAVVPVDVSRRIAGREALIIDTYALGPGRERLKEGTVLYERAQPDQAIPVLTDSVRLLEAGLAVSTDAGDLHQALMTLGLAQVGMGDEASARANFRRAAVLDPARQLDTVRYSPDVVEIYEAIRAEIATETPSRVEVSASADAEVWVDGRALGATPVRWFDLPAGRHFLLVRGPGGAHHYEVLTLGPGESRTVDALLEARGLGVGAPDAAGRARQSRDLYRAVGAHTGDSLVLLAGETAPGQVGVQIYAPQSSSFSRPVTGEAGSDPVGALADLIPTVVGYIGDNGDLRPDRVSPTAIALDVGANDLLAGLLFEPPDLGGVVDERRGVPWFVWAGLGAVVAGGGAAAAVVVLNQPGEEVPANQNGTIQFGPVP